MSRAGGLYGYTRSNVVSESRLSWLSVMTNIYPRNTIMMSGRPNFGQMLLLAVVVLVTFV